MVIGVPKEHNPEETRTALTPQAVEKLVALGAEVVVEAGAGVASRISDDAYNDAGARIAQDRTSILSGSDIVLRVQAPPREDVEALKEGAIHISHLNPFGEKDLVETMASRKIQAIAMEMIPRTTRAQKMDSLSSQASLAGYAAVVLAADHLNQVFPMMVTPSGTLSPARIFIVGAGVAGLQAIATAKRLGAIVEAFDTRPVVEEQVRSLGARFVKVDLGETGQTKDGYARQLTDEQLQRQRDVMAQRCASADVVITTAQVFGRTAPVIVTEQMVRGMKPESVVIDMAVESGGNVVGSKLGEMVESHGVKIIGYPQLARRVPQHATQMYANNLFNLIAEYWHKDKKELELDPEDEIVQGCVLTRDGEIVNQRIKEAYTS